MGTDTTTTGTPVQPLDARRLLALIVLAGELPLPGTIQITRSPGEDDRAPQVALFYDSVGDASRWAAWLGATGTRTFISTKGRPSFHHDLIMWHGWIVGLYGCDEPTTGQPLDADTRAQLEQVAAVTVDDTAGGV